MFSKIISGVRHAECGRWLLGLLAFGLAPAVPAVNAGTSGPAPRVVSPVLVTSFEQIWQMTDAETREWHNLRMEYLVYYYDPVWKAMWGRSGETDSYLSLGSKPFPIKPGQKILIEGMILPLDGLNVDEAKVRVLAESVPMTALSTSGDIGNTQRFNKRLVTVEGFVDSQSTSDANHEALRLVVEGQNMLGQLLVRSEETVPQLEGSLIRAQGVYFARSEQTSTVPQLEIWIPSVGDITVLGQLDTAAQFELPLTAINQLSAAGTNAPVRIAGSVQAQEPGKSLTVRDKTGAVTFQTAQTMPVVTAEQVEVVGFPVPQGNEWTIRQGLYRRAQQVLTSFPAVFQTPVKEKNEVHRIKLDLVVYYFDPYWKAVWGRCEGVDNYLSLGEQQFPIKAGQRILIEGQVVPANGLKIDHPKTTLLADSVPLEILNTRGDIGNIDRFDKHVTSVVGYVDSEIRTDEHHLELDLVVEGRSVVVRLLLQPGETAPELEGALLQVKGVYSATPDPTFRTPVIEVWVQSLKDIAVEGSLSRDKQFELPVTPIEKIAATAPDGPVHLVGIVREQQPGKSLTIRDETGQLVMQTAQTRSVQLGERVEAVGFSRMIGSEWVLHSALYRRMPITGLASARELTSLRLADQLRELPAEAAARSYPVQLRGIVTWANHLADFFYLQDNSGGVCVFHPPTRIAGIVVGASVELNGMSAAGKFVPVVLATSAKTTATVDLPEARQVSLEQALTGVEEAQWVAMSGYVRGVVQDGPWARLELTTSAGEFSALLPWNTQISKLLGSVVRVRGVCSALTNAKRQLTGIQLWVPSPQYLEIEEAEPADLFTVAARSIASLRQFNSIQAANRRVRVTGVVVQFTPGHVLHIQEGTEAVMALSAGTAPLVPGDRVEVVGFPGREGNRVILREAVYRRVAGGAEPVPVEISKPNAGNFDLDGQLVHIEATLLDLGAQERGTRLIMQKDGTVFEALLDAEKNAAPDDWVPGSRLGLTGVYQVQFDENKRPHSVQLQLRSVQDVRVLQHPSWWTGRHLLAVTGVLFICVVLGLAWVSALRRQVRRQTVQIRAQIEIEKAARLDAALVRASKLESLGLLAGGIAHDFNNLLTVIMGNLSLVRLIQRLDPESTRCLQEGERAAQRARDLTQQLLTFAKGGAPIREAVVLADVVREAAEFGLHGSKVRGEFILPSGLWAADVDKGQIMQVVHNIVINAIQAMPDGGVMQVELGNAEVAPGVVPALAPGRYLKLVISDSGVGIPPESLPRIFEPYFTTKKQGSGLGLATVYSIIKKHGGHIEAASSLGQGSTFSIWLPAATAPVASVSAPSAPAQAKTGWILLMDDEASIRQMTELVLQRHGFKVTAVADGAEAVREYRAALETGRRYDVVILDLTVPGGMGGRDAMEKLRQVDPDVCAVVSSGYSSDPVMANYRAFGFWGVVAKPYEAEALIKTVSAILPPQETQAEPIRKG